MNIQLTDVVKNLLIINILFFFGSHVLLGEGTAYRTAAGIEWDPLGRNILSLFYPTSDYFQPWQFATHFFMHSDFGHILFNMFGLVMFGPALETALGPKKFLTFYFICAVGASLLHLGITSFEISSNPNLVNIPVLGASGAIYGVLAGFATKFPQVKLSLLFLPFALPAAYFILLLVGYDLISGIGTLNSGTGGVAHFAHIGGALVGFLLIKYWERYV